MGRIIRSVIGVVVGIAVGIVLIFLIEMVSQALYPPPPGMDAKDTEALKAYVATLPAGAFVILLVAYAVGTFCGAFLAALIAGRAHLIHAFIIGGFFLFGGILNTALIPHPTWFVIACLATFPIASFVGGIVAALKQRPKK